MNPLLTEPTLFDTAEMSVRVQSNMRQMSRISYKRKEALQLAEAIKEYFEQKDIPLSQFRKPKKKKDEKVKGYMENKIFNDQEQAAFEDELERMEALGIGTEGAKVTLRCKDAIETIDAFTLYPDFVELSKAYYSLVGGNKSIVARFKSGNQTTIQLMAHWYSRHKICPVWNMRKSQIVRKKYREFLESYSVAVDETGTQELLIKSHTPVHMVLTIPHGEGLFEGQRFYARKLLQYFHEMRRCKFFKDQIFGGEYGLEIKKSKAGNGLHIHLHSFCFLKNQGDEKQNVNLFRKKLAAKWEALTGATFCHFETLFFYKKDENNQWIMQPAKKKNANGSWDYEYEKEIEIVKDSTGEWVRRFPKFVRKKHYINGESSIQEYTAGVMECIKYHFKMDDYRLHAGDPDEDGVMIENDGWDVPLIQEILNNSVNLRFYSRYGGFLKISELNFNSVAAKEEPTLENEEDIDVLDPDEEETNVEETIMASSEGVQSSLVNPFTMEPALLEEYSICVVKPERLNFRKDKLTGRDHLYFSADNPINDDDFIEVNKELELRHIIKAVCTNQLADIALEPILLKEFYKN